MEKNNFFIKMLLYILISLAKANVPCVKEVIYTGFTVTLNFDVAYRNKVTLTL
jgi:hypothetical protein